MLDFNIEIAANNVPNHKHVNVFGRNASSAAAGTEDVWEDGGAYSYPSTALMTSIRQAVHAAGNVDKEILITGLDSNWNEVVQTAALHSTTTTTLVTLDTALVRVNKMEVKEPYVLSSNVELTNATGTTTYCAIAAGEQESYMALYTVPNGYTGYITNFQGGATVDLGTEPTSTTVELLLRDNVNSRSFKMLKEIGVSGIGTKQVSFSPYIQVPATCDVRVLSKCVAQAAGVSASFDMILVAG